MATMTYRISNKWDTEDFNSYVGDYSKWLGNARKKKTGGAFGKAKINRKRK